MAGVLEFTLGLQANQFIQELGVSARELLSFSAVAEGTRIGFEKMWGAVEKGADLQALANRTRESAGTMYELEQGLKAVGVEADASGGMVLRIQRALTGVTAEGENAQVIFAMLGLHMRDLKQMDAAGQMNAIAVAFSHLDKNTAAGLAQKLFGREGAGNILQISAAVKDFAAGIESSARNAAVWDRGAEAFHQMEALSGRIKEDFSTIWAEIAEKAAPSFELVGGYLEKLLQGFTAAFEQGKVTELISRSIVTGFEIAFDMVPALAANMAMHLNQILTRTGIEMGEDLVRHQIKAGMAKNPGNIGTQLTGSFLLGIADMQRDRLDKGMDKLFSAENAQMEERMATALDKSKNAIKPLGEFFDKLFANAPKFDGGASGGDKGKSQDLVNSLSYTPKFTGIENIGAIMPGLNNAFKDDARYQRAQIIQGIKELVSLYRHAEPFLKGAWWVINQPL